MLTMSEKHSLIWEGPGFKFQLYNNPIIYSIINCTPDSFYDGNQNRTITDILKRIEKEMAYGAQVFELGGKSSKPYFKDISVEEEWGRIKKVILEIRKNFPEIVLAVDTNETEVMKKALDAGVNIINDIDGFATKEKLEVIKKYKPGIVTMKNSRGDSKQKELIQSLYEHFKAEINKFEQIGISKRQLVLDAGVGFTYKSNMKDDMYKIKATEELKKLNVALLVGISRKSFTSKLFGVPTEDRLLPTLLVELIMIINGGRVIRVHDVKETALMIDIVKQYLSI